MLCEIDEASGRAVAAELGATFLRCDVSSYEQVVATTLAAETLHGGLNLVFLNAGVATGCGVADDFEVGKYRRAMAVNFDGVVFGGPEHHVSRCPLGPRCRPAGGSSRAARGNGHLRWRGVRCATVALTAQAAGAVLITLDRRALATYEQCGAAVGCWYDVGPQATTSDPSGKPTPQSIRRKD